jgi:hypothetical protein
MATLTASAKLTNAFRVRVVDKNISAAITSTATLAAVVRRTRRTYSDLESTFALANTMRYATKGGQGIFAVSSNVVCEFPTYIEIDIEALMLQGLPEGTDCVLNFQEGWQLEDRGRQLPSGAFEYGSNTQNAPSPEFPSFVTFRTPKFFRSAFNALFSIPNTTALRIKQLSSSVSSTASFTALPIFNPGKFAALFAGVSQTISAPVKTAVSGANLLSAFGPTAMAITGFLRTTSANTSATFTSIVNGLRVKIFYSNIMSSSSTVDSTGKRIRFGVTNASAIFTSTITTLESRRRTTSSTISALAFFSNAKVGRIRPASSTINNITASMTINANKIGLVFEKLNPNPVGTPAFDFFGWDVAINDTYFAVSAPQEDEGAENDTGRVYIYSTTTGNLVTTLLGNTYNSFGTPAGDRFGESLNFNPANNNELAVGTPYEDNGYSDNGRVNIINASNGALISTYQLPSSVATGSWEQGQDVALSTNYVVIGSRVRVDVRNRTTGNIAFSLPININDAKVAISGNNIIVGFAGENKAYIYNASTGALIRTLTGPVASSGFGSSVAIDGTFAIVGANSFDTGGFLDVGRVYVYNLSNGTLARTLDYPSPARDYIGFGGAVAMSDTHILVGGDTASADGHFHLFEINGTRIRSWEEGSTGLGDAVAIVGNNFIVGGIWKTSGVNSASGVARVYSINKP